MRSFLISPYSNFRGFRRSIFLPLVYLGFEAFPDSRSYPGYVVASIVKEQGNEALCYAFPYRRVLCMFDARFSVPFRSPSLLSFALLSSIRILVMHAECQSYQRRSESSFRIISRG